MSEATSQPISQPAAPGERVPLPDPLRRNWVWFTAQQIAQFFFTIWFRTRALGIENLPPGGALLLINHQSFLDPLMVGLPLPRPVSFLARDNLFRIPIVGWILRHTYVIPISRERGGTESLRESIRRMDHGFLVGIFPEGTRSIDGKLQEMKPGFISLVRRAKVPVIPVAVAGAYESLPRNAKFPRRGKIRVVFGQPMNPVRLAELSQPGREAELVEWTRSSIQVCLDLAYAHRQ
jgi:1-acyl-sn-glycerol-3-phosphate acyltransferase